MAFPVFFNNCPMHVIQCVLKPWQYLFIGYLYPPIQIPKKHIIITGFLAIYPCDLLIFLWKQWRKHTHGLKSIQNNKMVEVVTLEMYRNRVCSQNKNNPFRLFFVLCIFIDLLERKRAMQVHQLAGSCNCGHRRLIGHWLQIPPWMKQPFQWAIYPPTHLSSFVW